MSDQQHVVTAAAVKVSIGTAGGNRIARLLRRGDLVPEGIVDEQLQRLTDRGLIAVVAEESEEQREVTVPDGAPASSWTVPQIEKYAEQNGVDLSTVKGKPDKLAAITADYAVKHPTE